MHTGKIDIIILWEHELIAASKALMQASKKDSTQEDVESALKACFAALGSDKLAESAGHITILKAEHPNPGSK